MATQRDRKETSRAAHARAQANPKATVLRKRTPRPAVLRSEPEAAVLRVRGSSAGKTPTALAHGRGGGCDGEAMGVTELGRTVASSLTLLPCK